MPEDRTHGDPDRRIQAQPPQQPEDRFLGGVGGPAPPPAVAGPPAGPPPVPDRTFGRVILPICLFAVIIALIAWVTQYLPSWQGGGAGPDAPAAGSPAGLDFPKKTPNVTAALALWQPEDPKYHLECEFGQEGSYDYLFVNNQDKPIQVGLVERSCDCSHLKICVLSPERARAHAERRERDRDWLGPPPEVEGADWHELEPDDPKKSVTVPPGQGGLVRLAWKNRKQPGSSLNLRIQLWTQPADGSGPQEPQYLQALVVGAPPVQFHPPDLEVAEEIAPNTTRTGRLLCWSATRDDLEVLVDQGKLPPYLRCQVTPLPPGSEELRQWEKKVPQSRVLAAAEVRVTVSGSAPKADDPDGPAHELEMGPFQQQLPLTFVVEGVPVPLQPPYVRGWVKSEVRVGGAPDRSTLNLGTFSYGDRRVKDFVLFAPPGGKLELLTHRPPLLQIELKRRQQTEAEASWDLRVTVPVGVSSLPESSGLRLQVTRPDGQTNRVWIPITGTVAD